jgi:hypothetical protein
MYSDRWSQGLRQGDVVGEIPFPLPTKTATFVASGGIAGYQLTPEMAVVRTSPRYVAVVSHDCEFTEERRDHFLVARIESFPRNLNDDQLEEIKLGNDIIDASGKERRFALDTFYLDPCEGVFERPQRINFCTMTPFAMSSVETMRALKKAELDQPTRVLLRTKIGLFFARHAEDVPDEMKTDAPKTAEAED